MVSITPFAFSRVDLQELILTDVNDNPLRLLLHASRTKVEMRKEMGERRFVNGGLRASRAKPKQTA
jgi:hypothetical protein